MIQIISEEQYRLLKARQDKLFAEAKRIKDKPFVRQFIEEVKE